MAWTGPFQCWISSASCWRMSESPLSVPDAPAPAFDPVPLRYRRDGWTPVRQAAFIAALSACRCILEACRWVGKSSESAYRLYRRPDAAGFRRAWDAALAPAPRPPPPPSTSGPPSTSAPGGRARAPNTAFAVWPMPGTPLPDGSRQASTFSASSTSAPTAEVANGTCRNRRLHQLPHVPPSDRQLAVAPAPRPRPAYSLEAFERIAAASPRARKKGGGGFGPPPVL